MTVMNVHEAKTHFSRLLAEVEAGGEVVIARAGTPVARLVRMDAVVDAPKPKRRLGGLEGMGFVIPDDFDTFMQDEIIAMFEGEEPDEGARAA